VRQVGLNPKPLNDKRPSEAVERFSLSVYLEGRPLGGRKSQCGRSVSTLNPSTLNGVQPIAKTVQIV